MSKKILSVYLNLQDKDFVVPSYLKDEKYLIHVCPESFRFEKLSQSGIDTIRSELEKGCMLGQRGNYGYCPSKELHELDRTDPWHDGFCPYPYITAYDFEDQERYLGEGKGVLESVLGNTPKIYSPINHLWDQTNVSVAIALGFTYMMEKDSVGLPIYDIGLPLMEKVGLFIIPETKATNPIISGNQNNFGIYTRYDSLQNLFVKMCVRGHDLVLPEDIEKIDVDRKQIALNHAKKMIGKYKRDVKSIKH